MPDKYLYIGSNGKDTEREAISSSVGVADAGKIVALGASGRLSASLLGSGSVGAGSLFLADDGTWKAISGGGSATGNNGVSTDGSAIVLGQAVNQLSDPAKLLSNREIPFNEKELTFIEKNANGILLFRLQGNTGDGVTKSIFEFNNGGTYNTAANNIWQFTHYTDRTLRLWGKDGVNGWVNNAIFEYAGNMSLFRALKIRQSGQVGNSVYEIMQDTGTGQTDVLLVKRSGSSTTGGADPSYSLLEIDAPDRTLSTDPQEATLSLCRKFGTRNEFLDVFNNGYPSGGSPSMDMGLRVQRRGVTAVLRDFVIQYASSITTVRDIVRIKPLAMDVDGLLTDAETWFTFGRYILRGNTTLQFNDANDSHYIRLISPSEVATNRTITLPQNAPFRYGLLETDATGVTKWGFGDGTTFVTSSYTATVADSTILCNFSTTQTITLPSAVGIAGKKFTIKRIFGVGLVGISTVSSQQIDNSAATLNLTDVNDTITIISDGANWFSVARIIAASGGSGATYSASSIGTTLVNATWSVAPANIAYRWKWSRVGNLTTFELHAFGTAASTLTDFAFDLPTTCPVPDEWTLNLNAQYSVATVFATNANVPVNGSRGLMQKISTGSGWRISCACASSAVRYFSCFITYRSAPGTGSLDP